METQILDAMQWRYAVQKYDQTKKLSDEQVATLMDVVRHTASSFGVEPWHFIVVSNPDLRAQLKDVSYGQGKVAEASHLVVLAQKTDFHTALDEHIQAMSTTNGGAPLEAFDGYKTAVGGAISGRSEEDVLAWMGKQVYIALGTLLQTAALMRIDASPMEGFDSTGIDKLLGLEEKGLHSVTMAAIGYRDPSDEAGARPKVRLAAADVISYVK